MKQGKKNYQFINSQTDNVIGYFSAPDGEAESTILKRLEKKRHEIAVKIGVYIEKIYWRKQDLA